MEQFLTFIRAVSLIGSPLCAFETLPDNTCLCAVAMAGDYDTASVQISHAAFQKLLFGDTQVARQAAESAQTPLAHACLYMIEPNQKTRSLLEKDLSEQALTPQEIFWIDFSLMLGSGDIFGAAQKAICHVKQFRNDTMAAAWGIILLHYSGDEYQNESQQLAQEALALHPDDVFLLYARAIVEEGTKSVSEEAIQSAEQATQALPSEPILHLLHAHLLFHAKRYDEALVALESVSGTDTLIALQAEYARAVIQFVLHRPQESLATRRHLNALALTNSSTAPFLGWESHTLPLRVLITRPERLTLTEIRAAKTAATLPVDFESVEIIHLYRDCLVSACLARYHQEKGKGNIAQHFLQKAESHYADLLRQQNQVKQGGTSLTYYFRACEACNCALHRVRAILYPDMAETWMQNAAEAVRPSARLLPPALP